MKIRRPEFIEPRPFEYYPNIKFDDQIKGGLIQRVFSHSIQFSKNTYYLLCNTTISFANALQLHKLKKSEPYRPIDTQLGYLIANLLGQFDDSFWKLYSYKLDLSDPFSIIREKLKSYYFSKILLPFYIKFFDLQLYRECVGSTIDNTKKFASGMLIDNLPIISTLTKIHQIHYISKRTLQDLKGYWRLAYHKPIKAMTYSLVNVSTLALAVVKLYVNVIYDYNSLRCLVNDSTSTDSKTWQTYYKQTYKDLSDGLSIFF